MVVSTQPRRYRGNAPKSVRKAAKYRVKHDAGEWAVQLQYVLDKREYALLTTRDHPGLVEMVNRAKESVNDGPGGAFYINEYGRVIVPSTDGDYYEAGTYDEILEFDFDGEVVSSRPTDGLEPGDEWPGPHAGIPYVLTAERSDIRYEIEFGDTRRKCLLSDDVGPDAARRLAQRLLEHKKDSGRIYINECREFFAPISGADEVSYIYLGPLGDDAWFQNPPSE